MRLNGRLHVGCHCYVPEYNLICLSLSLGLQVVEEEKKKFSPRDKEKVRFGFSAGPEQLFSPLKKKRRLKTDIQDRRQEVKRKKEEKSEKKKIQWSRENRSKTMSPWGTQTKTSLM